MSQSFYYQQLNKAGEPAVDAWGMPLIDCNRGTPGTENAHRQLIVTFGTWNTGLEMSEALLSERRHRHNISAAESRRVDYPKLGHVDTWLVDLHQRLVYENHGVILYPNWSSATDFVDTAETFGTVRIHSSALNDAMNLISVEPCRCRYPHKCKCPCKLTSDQQFMCRKMKTKLPFLPVNGPSECKLFATLMLNTGSTKIDFEEMAIAWCAHVDGKVTTHVLVKGCLLAETLVLVDLGFPCTPSLPYSLLNTLPPS